MNYVQLPKSSTSYTITIPVENSSTNNNNGKFKNYFISQFNDQSKFSFKFQAQVKTIKKITKFPSGILPIFLYSFYACCFACCCPLFSGFCFSESLLDSFLEVVISPGILSGDFPSISKFILIN